MFEDEVSVFSVVGRLNRVLGTTVVAAGVDVLDFNLEFSNDLAAAADLIDFIKPDGFVSFLVVLPKLDSFFVFGVSVVELAVGVAGADLAGFELGLLKVETPLLPCMV